MPKAELFAAGCVCVWVVCVLVVQAEGQQAAAELFMLFVAIITIGIAITGCTILVMFATVTLTM